MKTTSRPLAVESARSGAGQPPSAYAQAGVDIDEKLAALAAVKRMIHSTATRGVMSDIGLFGGLFASPGSNTVLVASTDGVGTKIKVAVMSQRHTTIGQDIVNHCVNDILVQGARPLFFLDYIGTSHVEARVIKAIMKGLCAACRANGCALLGGETAEMPGVYPSGEYDLVGTIIGVVERGKIIAGRKVRAGDVLIGLPSSGLHTNGYSLARRVLFEQAGLGPADFFPGLRRTVADVLLAVHRSYLRPVMRLIQTLDIHALAHITGGGFPDNVPRVLPEGLTAVIDRAAWRIPAVFRFIQAQGRIELDEMYRVFNMGIGFILIVAAKDVALAMRILARTGEKAVPIGHIAKGTGRFRWAS